MKALLVLLLAGTAHADATWPQIEQLAKPILRGPSTELDHAIDHANLQENDEARAALHAWVVAKGGLPTQKPGDQEPRTVPIAVARLAIEGGAFADAAYLAKVMIEDATGSAGIEAGAKTLRRIRARTNDKLPAAKADLVHMFAGQALRVRGLAAWMRTPDGEKAMSEFFGKLDPAMFDSDVAFLLRGLDGAKRGESPDVTLDRLDHVRGHGEIGYDRAKLAQAVSDISELGK